MSSLAQMWSEHREDSTTFEDRCLLNFNTIVFCVEDFVLTGSALVTETEGSRDLESSHLTSGSWFSGQRLLFSRTSFPSHERVGRYTAYLNRAWTPRYGSYCHHSLQTFTVVEQPSSSRLASCSFIVPGQPWLVL